MRLECLFTDANLDLVGERIDLASRLAPAIETDVIAAKLMDTQYRVVASPEYLAAANPLLTPSDLRNHKCLLFNLPAYQKRWLFRNRSNGMFEVPISGDLVLSPAGSLRQAALDGFGPALLPNWLVDEDIAAGRLHNPFPDYEVAATTFDTAAWLGLLIPASRCSRRPAGRVWWNRFHLGRITSRD